MKWCNINDSAISAEIAGVKEMFWEGYAIKSALLIFTK